MIQGERVINVIGQLLRYFAFVCLVPVPIALIADPRDLAIGSVQFPSTAFAFLLTATVSMSASLAIHIATKRAAEQELHEKEAYIAVAIGWVVLTIFGALPFMSFVTTPADAWFESMSGLTATGATILTDIEAAPASIIFWRALLQFVAGLGIAVVGVSLLARLTHGGSQLLAGEVGGASRLRPKLRETAKSIWKIYGSFATAVAILYVLAMRFTGRQVPWNEAIFDGIVHAAATVSTGGFSSRNGSLGYYDSPFVEAVAIIFMLAAGTSFALWYHVRRSPHRLYRDKEWQFYIKVVAFGAIAVWGLIWLAGDDSWTAWRGSIFTMVSVATSTGFATVDHDGWPTLARMVLIVGMFIGAMAGSTSGGMKMLRVMLLLKVARRELRKLLHPRAVIPIRLGNKTVSEQSLLTVIAFFFSYITVWIAGAALLIMLEPRLGMLEGGAAAAAAIGNTGPSMGIVGPFNNYHGLKDASKFVLGALMWIGRVEVFSALLVFSPTSWRR